ncbi:hypothetical protein KI387_033611 [Taxus chinensis]|uniref:Uncharacterized protein n=1 Tax=Taxus chinensis TaxID=29808 RepID=A0AA38F214_TAXCH|nr:hypothetical protein KI387_033611 [Taxus chinensis]
MEWSAKILTPTKKEARQLFPQSNEYVPACFKNGVDWIFTIFESRLELCSNWIMGLRFPIETTSGIVTADFVKLPSAVELNNAGVKLQPVFFRNTREIQRTAAMQWIRLRFDERTSTLHLPEVNVTSQSMTQFAKLMDVERVDSEENVAVQREAGIIKNDMGSSKEAAQVFNSLSKEIIYSVGCKPIDDVRMGLHKYTKRKYKILWREFVTATLLLLMTVVQVLCLFYKCGA